MLLFHEVDHLKTLKCHDPVKENTFLRIILVNVNKINDNRNLKEILAEDRFL